MFFWEAREIRFVKAKGFDKPDAAAYNGVVYLPLQPWN